MQKYLTAPAKLPEDLIWFKWEAYLTWVTGFLLLIVQYYFQASAYLIDPAVFALTPWQAIAISIVSLVAGWLVYDTAVPLAARPQSGNAGGSASLLLILIAAYGFTQVFSGRGAFIHVGAHSSAPSWPPMSSR